MFITLEGPEGSGKSTQARLLVEALQRLRRDVLATREPGGTPIGEQIREVIHSLKNTDMQERTEILLFQASRAQLVEQVIRPHLANGGVVVCDRYADSTLAYQGYGFSGNERIDLDAAMQLSPQGWRMEPSGCLGSFFSPTCTGRLPSPGANLPRTLGDYRCRSLR